MPTEPQRKETEGRGIGSKVNLIPMGETNKPDRRSEAPPHLLRLRTAPLVSLPKQEYNKKKRGGETIKYE